MQDGCTLLRAYAEYGNMEDVLILLKAGSDASATDKVRTGFGSVRRRA